MRLELKLNHLKWRQRLAQLIDYLSVFLMGSWAASILPYFIDVYYYAIFGLVVVPVIFIPLEALWLWKLGTTPGRALLGISVVERLSLVAAFQQASPFCPRKEEKLRPLSRKRAVCGALIAMGCLAMSFLGGAVARWSIDLDRPLSNEGWIQYVDREGGFKVHFPKDPAEEAKQLEIPNGDNILEYQEITAKQQKIQYSVTYMELPRKWKLAGTNMLLKVVLDLIVHYSPDTALLNKELINHQHHRALDFHLKQGSDEVRGRLIIVGTTLYKLTMVYPAELSEEVKENPFLESFDLYIQGN